MSKSSEKPDDVTELGSTALLSDLKMSFTEQELRDATTDYMLKIYGKPKDMTDDDQDRWFTRSGLLLGFVANLFNPEMFSDNV